MEKTIKIGDVDVKLSNNIGWALAYRDQFDHDIIPVLMPLLAAGVDVVRALLDEVGNKKEVGIDDLLNVMESEEFMNALIHASGFESVELINITWALAKCADETIEEPSRWVRQFDVFPLDEILPEVIRLVTRGVVSSKNLERLKGIRGSITVKVPTLQP